MEDPPGQTNSLVQLKQLLVLSLVFKEYVPCSHFWQLKAFLFNNGIYFRMNKNKYLLISGRYISPI